MSEDGRPGPATAVFVAHRNLLFTIAYEMLGSAADAEDVLQETWLRWANVDLDMVRDQRAYLVRVATRQALTRLRTLGLVQQDPQGPPGPTGHRGGLCRHPDPRRRCAHPGRCGTASRGATRTILPPILKQPRCYSTIPRAL